MCLHRRITSALLVASMLLPAGCTGPIQYIRNGFKVGPNYGRPPAPVATNWIDSADPRVRRDGEPDHFADWWAEFDDPVLDALIEQAYRENLTLREAGFRILAARAQLGFAVGSFFPQLQTANGSYTRFGIGQNFFDQWNFGFNLGWELDFWGRFRRAIDGAEATLDASVEDYDAVLVTLLGDVASNYVSYRTTEERIRLLQNVVSVQQDVLKFINQQLSVGGVKSITDVDRAQASSDLAQSLAQLDALQIQLRQSQNILCTLLGMPVSDISAMLNRADRATIPTTPDYVVAGIPADLLRRRPDVRRAERQAAAQAEEIGIAAADLYPAFSVTGTLGWQAAKLSDLFKPQSLNSNVGPSFQWNVLNYGRIVSNVRFQDAQFQGLRDGLSEQRAAGGPRGREWHRLVPQVAGASAKPESERRRGGARAANRDRAIRERPGNGGFQSLCRDPTDADPAAGPVGPVAGRHCTGIDRGVSGTRRRLADSVRVAGRGAATRLACGRSAGRPSGKQWGKSRGSAAPGAVAARQ